MSTATTLLKGSVTRVSQTFVSIAVAFFMMPFLIHELGDHWYGVWTVVGSLAAAYHLFDMGMATAVTRYASRFLKLDDHDEANRVVNTALAIYLVIAAVIAVASVAIGFASRWFFDTEADKDIIQLLVMIIGVSVALEFPFNALAGVAGARLRFHQVALARIVTTLIGAGLNVWFISHGYGIVALAVITFATARLSNLLYYLICKSAFPQLRFRRRFITRTMGKELFQYSAWSFVIAIAYQLRNNVDNFVIAGFLSAASVTPYAIGVRLVDYLAQFLSQATNMFVPVFTGYHAKGEQAEMNRKMLFVTRINLVLAMVAGGGLVIFGQAFIARWMGPDYQIAYWVMVVLLVGRMIGFANHPLNSAMYAMNRHRVIAKLDLIEVGCNLILSVILVQFYGLMGVAFGTMIPLLVLRIVFLPALACRVLGMPASEYYASLARPIAVMLPTLAVAYYLVGQAGDLTSYLTIFSYAAAVAFATTLIGVKLSFSREEKDILRQLIPQQRLKALL
ncbi:lipopolysaccharide biosynthesis protein [Marinobacter bohaiensis]|uniref:lipopolysaccharide biosynthesis protein n=1 Tax=Marinobacter bohaiensis TaxID=2201898 RepID=UPI000DAD41F2|nr:oligosaccharide flippase family protein [Marinobacter bohaiensis]